MSDLYVDDEAKVRKLGHKIFTNCTFFSLTELRGIDHTAALSIIENRVSEYLRMEQKEDGLVERVLKESVGCKARRADLLTHYG